jgi:hypothetical protein
MNATKKFLLFCSGIDLAILKKCPSDENKYVGIGATVLFTGILAFFSAGYALFTVFDSYILAVLFGLVWGLMIFNLDRYIVSSMKSFGSFWRDLMVAFPRLLMAVLLALVISKPLELKIFEKEINAELIIMEQEVFKTQEDKIKLRFQNQIESHQTELTQLKTEIESKTTIRDQLALSAIQEADGTGGSMNKNLGPIYRAKKQEADNAQTELDQTLQTNLPLIEDHQTAISLLGENIQKEITALNRSNYGGIAARMDALDRLSQGSMAIYLANIFIMLLFISIETAPIFVKLISYRSPYDYLLHEHEHVFQMANLEKTSLLATTVKNKLHINTEVETHRANAQVAGEKQLIDEALKQKLGEIKNQPVNWEQVILKKGLLD